MITAKSSKLPDASTFSRISVEGIVRANELNRDDAIDAGMTSNEFARLNKAWKAFKGPVRNPEHFMVCAQVDPENYACAEYDHGEIRLDVIHEEDLDEKLLVAIEPVERIRAEKRVSPNSKCPCGSSKKFKRCCGR